MEAKGPLAMGCGTCGTPLEPEDIDLDTGIVKCRRCLAVFDVGARGGEVARRLGVRTPQRPVKTRITVSRVREGALAMVIPASWRRAWFVLGLAILWLSFVAFWTVATVANRNTLSLWSIPFWGIGLAVLWIGLRIAFTRTVVYLSDDGLAVGHKLMGRERDATYDIDPRARAYPEESPYNSGDEDVPMMRLVLPSKGEAVRVGHSLTPAEAAWLAHEINAWVNERFGTVKDAPADPAGEADA